MFGLVSQLTAMVSLIIIRLHFVTVCFFRGGIGFELLNMGFVLIQETKAKHSKSSNKWENIQST
jgi:hypothetical protein